MSEPTPTGPGETIPERPEDDRAPAPRTDREPETYSEDIADLALTPEQEREADVGLDDPSAVDDVPWNPPQQRPVSAELADMDPAEDETIDQRIRQEEPDPSAAADPATGEDPVR